MSLGSRLPRLAPLLPAKLLAVAVPACRLSTATASTPSASASVVPPVATSVSAAASAPASDALLPPHSLPSALVKKAARGGKLVYSGARARRTAHAQWVDKVVRVDHAGELGALRIYQGQLAVLDRLPEWWAPGAHTPSRVTPLGETPVEAIRHMLDQEREHLDTFIHLMGERQARPTIIAPIWSAAGFAAGAATALAGEKMAMALTSAVEEVITEHYNDQIREVHELGLRETEAPLRKLLVQFRDDEAEHRATAIHHHALEAPFYEAFSRLVKAGCLTAIFVAERV